MSTENTFKLTRRKALALGISSVGLAAAGASSLEAAVQPASTNKTQTNAAIPIAPSGFQNTAGTKPATGLPDKERVDVGVITRDPRIALESVATVEASFTIDTPIGTSPLIRKLRYKGVPFYSIARFGDEGSGEVAAADDEAFPGERTVQIWVTFMTLGVRNVLNGGFLIGCVNPEWSMTDAVIIDDFIDFKPGHPQSILPYFYRGKSDTDWKHWGTRMNPVLCPDLRLMLYDQAQTYHFSSVHYGGTMAQTRYDRWETPAEVRMLRDIGVDVTNEGEVGTYIVYARQAGIHFANIMVLLNFAEGERPIDAPRMSALDSDVRVPKTMRMSILETIAQLKDYQHHCDCFRLEEKRYRDVFPYTTK